MIAEYYPILLHINLLTIFLRMGLAVVCGGVIGLERGRKGRPAGFRTHILVCVGAALAMMTNQYIVEMFGTSDPARLGAQVISGIGFLGAGTIIVTGRHQVKGLTTAAGLWASACMGLALGIGFYEAAIVACIIIIFVSTLLHRFDHHMLSTSKVMDLYVEFGDAADISTFMSKMKPQGIKVVEVEFSKVGATSDAAVAAIMTIRSDVSRDHSDVLALVSQAQGVKFVEGL
ncbi:MAG: MgtC/SapB family protein [Angelakisella sp.]